MTALLLAGCLVPSRPEALYEPLIVGDGPAPWWVGEPTSAEDAPVEPRKLEDSEARAILSKERLGLEDCYRLALRRNEQLRILGEDLVQSALLAQKAIGALLPHVSIDGDYNIQEGEIGIAGRTFAPKDTWNAYAHVTQSLFTGFREVFVAQQARALGRSQVERIRAEKRILFVSVADAYAGVLRARRDVANIEFSLEVQEERLKETETRIALGVARRADLLLSQAHVARDRASLEAARERLRIAEDLLMNLTGLERSYEVEDLPHPDAAPGPVGPLIAEAAAERPEIRSQREAIVAAEKAVLTAIGGHSPTVTAEGSYYLHREGFLEDIDWEITINARIPIFEGGQTQAGVRSARSQLRQAVERARATRRQIDLEVRQAYSEVLSARALLEASEKELAASDESYRAIRTEYTEGVATNLEVLTAESLLLGARVARDTQRILFRLAHVHLMTAVGRLPGTMEER